MKVHDRAALAEPVTPVGETVHDVLLVVRLTTPVNPFWDETVTAAVLVSDARTVMLVVFVVR